MIVMDANGSKLTKRMLNWVIDAIDRRKAEVVMIEQLKGSTSSTLFRISLRMNRCLRHVVFRLFDNQDWLEEEPDLVLHEAMSLRCAAKTDIATPNIIAWDETGEICGFPAVLMTMLDGTVQLKPNNLEKWLRSLASALGKIHAIDANDFNWEYFTYNDISSLETPPWTSIPQAWERAIEIVKCPRPSVHECFIHRDYHPANVLYLDGKVTGVVDWVNACKGPAGIDVGHCRVNLAMLYNVATADQFLAAYQQDQGSKFVYDVYWDVVSLIDILSGPPVVYPGWEAFGVTGLTDTMMRERLDKYVVSLLERAS